MLRRTPSSILFPYTTLFRSMGAGRGDVEQAHEPRIVRELETLLEHEGDAEHLEQHLDRKSTRLNSSHSQISYAVFCLKKKMKLLAASAANFPTTRIRAALLE